MKGAPKPPRVWADFNKSAPGGLPLYASGTISDLKEQGIELREGMELVVYDEDLDDLGRPDNLIAEGVVVRDERTGRWLLEIGPDGIRHESELRSGQDGAS